MSFPVRGGSEGGQQLYQIGPEHYSGFVAIGAVWIYLFAIFWVFYRYMCDVRPIEPTNLTTRYHDFIIRARTITLIMFTVETAIVLKLTTLGLGDFNDTIPANHLSQQRVYLALYNTLYAMCITGGKVIFALQLFRMTRIIHRVHIPTWCHVLVFCALFLPFVYGFVSVFGINLACGSYGPTNPTIDYKPGVTCMDYTAFWIAMSVIDILMELSTTFLTVLIYGQLLSWYSQPCRELCATALMRVLVIAACAWRMAQLVHQSQAPFAANVSFEATNTTIASQLQIALSFVTASAEWLMPFINYTQLVDLKYAKEIVRSQLNQNARLGYTDDSDAEHDDEKTFVRRHADCPFCICDTFSPVLPDPTAAPSYGSADAPPSPPASVYSPRASLPSSASSTLVPSTPSAPPSPADESRLLLPRDPRLQGTHAELMRVVFGPDCPTDLPVDEALAALHPDVFGPRAE